jgi:hypothetical protein
MSVSLLLAIVPILTCVGVVHAQSEASGTFAPAGPPSGKPARVAAGGACVIDLAQTYEVSGTLSGKLVADYRILVHGPCGAPPGKFDEEWIARGTFSGTYNGAAASATFWYTARVQAGGTVVGRMTLGDGLTGQLDVRGSFEDGHLSYAGSIGS